MCVERDHSQTNHEFNSIYGKPGGSLEILSAFTRIARRNPEFRFGSENRKNSGTILLVPVEKPERKIAENSDSKTGMKILKNSGDSRSGGTTLSIYLYIYYLF